MTASQIILATLVYLTDGKKTLMIHRVNKKGDIHKDKYNGLGGKFDPHESPLECAIREVREESGLNISDIVFKGHLLFPRFDKEGRDWLVFVFRADSFEGNLVTQNHEGQLKWIENERLLDLPLWEGDHYFLPHLFSDRIFEGVFHYRDGKLKDHQLTIL